MNERPDADPSADAPAAIHRAQVLGARRSDARRRLSRIEHEMAVLRTARAGESADDEHDPEGDTLAAEWSRLEGLRTAAHAELDVIERALASVAAGTYGVCADCGRAIPAERLEARPTATRCVDCASRAGL